MDGVRVSEIRLQRAKEWRDVVIERKEGWVLDGKREWRDMVEEWRDGVEEYIRSGALWPKARQ